MKTLTYTLFLSITIFVLLTGCGAQDPDWKALYSERLSQPIAELGDTYLGQEFMDPIESGSLTRAGWATFQGGSLVLLGLPPYDSRLTSQGVVERTVILREETWEQACADALGEAEVQSWRFRHAHRGNSIRIFINNQHETYCEFFYLPDGWELRTVHSHGIIKPRALSTD